MRRKLLSGIIAGCFAIGVFAVTSEANAVCKKPVGLFTGAGNGLAYFMDSGNTAEAAVIALSTYLYNDGTVYASEQGKSLTTGLYSRTWTVSPGNNSFSLSTCQGTIVNSLGQRFTYTSSNSGKVLTFIYTTNDNILAMYSFRLEKA